MPNRELLSGTWSPSAAAEFLRGVAYSLYTSGDYVRADKITSLAKAPQKFETMEQFMSEWVRL